MARGRIERAVAVYVVIATAWTAFGVLATAYLVGNTALHPVGIVLVHGLVFVVATALVLRGSLHRNARRVAAADAAERHAAERLREVARIRVAFLRGVSHELRTPLTNIVGYGVTLDSHLRELDREVAQELTSRLVANARRLEHLVLDLLDLDELDDVGPSVDIEPVRLDQLVDDVLSRVDREGHQLHVTVEDAVAHLDREKTERVVEELVANAIRHTPEGTTVWLRVRASGRSVCVTVEDDGPGIDPALRREVFEPFTQGTDAGAAPSPGLGIGLALVRRYAALQRGRVSLGASAAGGARFEIVLPRRPSATP